MEPVSVRDSGDVLTLGHIGDMYRRFGEVQGIFDEDHYRILTDALSRVKKRSEPLYGRLSSVYDMAKSVRTKKMTRGQLRTVLDRHLETFVTEEDEEEREAEEEDEDEDEEEQEEGGGLSDDDAETVIDENVNGRKGNRDTDVRAWNGRKGNRDADVKARTRSLMQGYLPLSKRRWQRSANFTIPHGYCDKTYWGLTFRNTVRGDVDAAIQRRPPTLVTECPRDTRICFARQLDNYVQLKKVLVDGRGRVFRAPDKDIKRALAIIDGMPKNVSVSEYILSVKEMFRVRG